MYPYILPKKVTIWEVLPRDGFQMESDWIETKDKIKIIHRLVQSGIKHVEATSFVHPKAIPQLKDAESVIKGIRDLDDVHFRALVPNLKGAERAIEAGVTKLKLLLSSTDSHSLANSNCTVKEAVANLYPIVELADKSNVSLSGSLTVTFGCPYEGKVSIDQISSLVNEYRKMGIKDVSLADTAGMGDPKLVFETLDQLHSSHPDFNFSMHLHNTRGMAFANVMAALQQSVNSFDSSSGGFGGCPYFPHAAGNIATEDLAHSLHLMGIETGIDVDDLLEANKDINQILGHSGSSFLNLAGQNKDLNPKPIGQKKIG